MNRRHFLASSSAAFATSLLGATVPKRIILRSSWQTVNIGDIGHTPGMLRLLEQHLPDADVKLWPSDVKNGVEEMLKQRFPKVEIVKGPEHLKAAFKDCDFLLHGSGPSFVAQKDVAKWVKETGKPFGVGGITLPVQGSGSTKPTSEGAMSETIKLLNQAKFVYFRDSKSLELAKAKGCTAPVMEFGPDGAFGVDLRAEEKAEAFLKANGLKAGEFLCCIPRLRFTPYWVIPSKKAKFDETKHKRNEAMKDHDHAAHREAITRIVRETSMKVLLCPEDETQMAVGKEVIFDKLPDDVKAKVVWRENYWLTDEALSTYIRSAGLFGNEMHSPIMCIGNGVPAIVCRWAEQTTKGFMWQDIGLSEWLFDFDNEADVKRLPEVALAMAKDPDGAKAKAAKALEVVHARQKAMMDSVKQALA
jgi:polysaccharide pyruvyl transferase WcaK-like protein